MTYPTIQEVITTVSTAELDKHLVFNLPEL